MKQLLIISVLFLALSCSKHPEKHLEYLEGYWEIEKVTLANGSKKEYTFSDTIDYISISDSLTGFRKKLKPNFSGTYQTSKDAEHIKIVIENDSLNLYYTTAFSSWKETVLKATDEQLIILNTTKDIYQYKRYHPLIIE